jgi:acetyl-CoA C-acetyltransferase
MSTGERTRRAVLAAVGEVWNDPANTLTDAVGLMSAAAHDAVASVSVPDLFDDVGLICANVASDDLKDPAGAAKEYLGMVDAATMVAEIGIPQQRLVSEALLAVETNKVDAVLILGGDAKASSLFARRSGRTHEVSPTGPGADTHLAPEGEFLAKAELDAALWDPFTQYALMDSALARSEGLSPLEHQQQVSELWSRFDAVAATNPEARFSAGTGLGRSADELSMITEENRLLAFPYNKVHSTQWAVDHGVALLVCSEELAQRRGLESVLYPRVALDTSWGTSMSRRAEPHRWQTMAVMGSLSEEHLGVPLASIGVAEVYSCFPAAVRIQQRELGLPLDGTPTITGGMPFCGGPLNHFTYLATTAVHRSMMAGGSELSLVTTVSGLITKGGLMVWGVEPGSTPALIEDVGEAARNAPPLVEVEDFGPERTAEGAGDLLARTITGGFNPTEYSLCRNEDPDTGAPTNVLCSRPATPGMVADPVAALS